MNKLTGFIASTTWLLLVFGILLPIILLAWSGLLGVGLNFDIQKEYVTENYYDQYITHEHPVIIQNITNTEVKEKVVMGWKRPCVKVTNEKGDFIIVCEK